MVCSLSVFSQSNYRKAAVPANFSTLICTDPQSCAVSFCKSLSIVKARVARVLIEDSIRETTIVPHCAIHSELHDTVNKPLEHLRDDHVQRRCEKDVRPCCSELGTSSGGASGSLSDSRPHSKLPLFSQAGYPDAARKAEKGKLVVVESSTLPTSGDSQSSHQTPASAANALDDTPPVPTITCGIAVEAAIKLEADI